MWSLVFLVSVTALLVSGQDECDGIAPEDEEAVADAMFFCEMDGGSFEDCQAEGMAVASEMGLLLSCLGFEETTTQAPPRRGGRKGRGRKGRGRKGGRGKSSDDSGDDSSGNSNGDDSSEGN